MASKAKHTSDNIDTLLLDLRRETGLDLHLSEADKNDSDTEARLTRLLSQVKTQTSKSSVLLRYLTGLLSEEEAEPLFFRNKKQEGSFELFLLRVSKSMDENSGILSVISELVDASSSELIKIDSNRLLLLRIVEHAHIEEDLCGFATELVDFLNTEAMTSAMIAYDRTISNFSGLPLSYQHLVTALQIGETFQTSDRVFGYHTLGLSKLIVSIPEDVAREFLEEELSGIDFNNFDSETRNTISVFFESGLNIAEAARVLYLHRNTLVYRLDKFYKTTGLDLRSFDDAIRIRIGMLIAERLK